ncbi:unnamed protein product [Echinostoma caproni]|uniref:Reverse transcriptase domain-containing protein n=1 Tax=Echinostoma caproni TaxID=27848 RepID=A0A183B9Q0_9TREM|nr:unnamed protein product [Echinostoma caproni]
MLEVGMFSLLNPKLTPSGMFETAINEVIRGLDVLAYHDGVIVFGITKAEHDDRLPKLLERFAQKNVSIRASKCTLSSLKLEFLDIIVDVKGSCPDPGFSRPSTELESPKDQRQLRSIMGYYSRFIPNFATRAQPLFAAEWKWTAKYEQILGELI